MHGLKFSIHNFPRAISVYNLVMMNSSSSLEMGDTWLGNAGNVMQNTSQLLVSQGTFYISWEDIAITIGE